MAKCLNCSNEVEQTKGKRPKLYCSDTCRATASNKRNAGKQPKYVQFKTFQELKTKFDLAVVELAKKPLAAPTSANKEDKPLTPPKKQSSGVLVSNEELEKQIKSISTEKIPEHRNTSLGRKIWQKEQEKRIAEIKAKLNI